MGARAEDVSRQPALAPSAPPSSEAKPAVHHARGLRLVLVRWHDAWFDFEHGSSGGWREDYLVQTVGFLVRQDRGVVSVAQELLPGRDGFRAVTHIPMGVVESIVTLAQGDGPGRRAGDRLLRSGAGTPPALATSPATPPALTPSPALAPAPPAVLAPALASPPAEAPPALSPRVGSGRVPAGRRSGRKPR